MGAGSGMSHFQGTLQRCGLPTPTRLPLPNSHTPYTAHGADRGCNAIALTSASNLWIQWVS